MGFVRVASTRSEYLSSPKPVAWIRRRLGDAVQDAVVKVDATSGKCVYHRMCSDDQVANAHAQDLQSHENLQLKVS
jgi:hypothetical protein